MLMTLRARRRKHRKPVPVRRSAAFAQIYCTFSWPTIICQESDSVESRAIRHDYATSQTF